MADTESTPWHSRPPARSVAGCTGTTAFTVHGGTWAQLAPGLPAELTELLAPPVTVSAAPVGAAPAVEQRRRADLARYRSNMASVPPYTRPRRPTRVN
jgi:hypothetical protein